MRESNREREKERERKREREREMMCIAEAWPADRTREDELIIRLAAIATAIVVVE